MKVTISRKIVSYRMEDYDVEIGETDSYGDTEIIVTDENDYTFSVLVNKNDVEDEDVIAESIKDFIERQDEIDYYHESHF